jgi:hypothetical protein
MNNYPIFLLPFGEIMMTAKIENSEIKLLHKTLFPSEKRYAISKSGLSACLDKEKKLIIYGQLGTQGEMENIRILTFPSLISPKSIFIVKNHILLGGENNSMYSPKINSHELFVTYDIYSDKFNTLEVPFKAYDKCIDDLLFDDDKIIAVDNCVEPKYLIEYDFSNPHYPHLLRTHNLPENGVYEKIWKGTLSNDFLALISSSFGMYSSGTFINIFNRNNKHIAKLSQTRSHGSEYEMGYSWRDIVLLSNYNLLLISSYDSGMGIYKIEKQKVDDLPNKNKESIIYFNKWNKNVIKILTVPNCNEKVIVVLEEVNENFKQHTYSLESIETLAEELNTVETDYGSQSIFVFDDYDNENIFVDKDDDNIFDDKDISDIFVRKDSFLRNNDEDAKPPYRDRYYNDEYDDDDRYCGACQSTPCMCSDPF